MFLLTTLHWDVHFTTVLDIIQAFLINGLIRADDSFAKEGSLNSIRVGDMSTMNLGSLQLKLRQVCSNIADWELQNFADGREYSVSKRALAVILIARKAVGIEDEWNIPHLRVLGLLQQKREISQIKSKMGLEMLGD